MQEAEILWTGKSGITSGALSSGSSWIIQELDDVWTLVHNELAP